MECPLCDSKCEVLETRKAKGYNAIIRRYKCPECLTYFKTSEKFIFSSLPKYLKELFLNTGERKIDK